MSHHWKRTAGVAAVLALVTSGCATATYRGDPDDDGGPLRFQSLAFQESTVQATDDIVEAWNEENPNTQVELVQGSWDSVQDQLVTQFQGGTAPDIIQYESSAMTKFAQQGYLADLSTTLAPETRDAVSDDIWDTVTVDGQVIAAPTLLQSYVVFANRDLLEQAGVEVPEGDTWSWDEFQEAAREATRGDVTGVGWGLADPTAAMMSMGLSFDGQYFEGSGDDAQIDVSDAELALPERIHEMAYDDGSLDPTSLTQESSDVLSGFLNGRYAMTVQASYQAQTLTESAPKDFDWVVLPMLADESAAQAANPQTLSVSAQSSDVEGASAFIDYYLRAQNLSRIAQGDWLIPATADAADEIVQRTDGADGWSEILAGQQFLSPAPYQSATGYPQWKDQIATPAFQRYLADEIDEDELDDELTSGWEDVAP